MKRLSMIAMLAIAALITGCSLLPMGTKNTSNDVLEAQAAATTTSKKATGHDVSAETLTVEDEGGTVVVQKVEFRSGISSATVERMAKRFGCYGGAGAGLVTQKGPVEVYRMRCDNGTMFVAQCELRQCRPMR